jgi:RND family efflux transporter MFP subunit
MMADLFKNSDDPAVKVQALTNLSAAQQKKDELIATYNWYTGKASQVDKENASIHLAQAQVDAAQAMLKSLEITAPFAGANLEVGATSGQSYAADTGLFKLTDPQALEVRASITEEDPLLARGMQAELYFDARPDVVIRGRVERIVPRRIEGDRPLYKIYISLNEVLTGLAVGMTVDTAVTIASWAGVLCLPRAVVRASGDGKAVLKIWNGLQTENRAITVGLRGDAFVEILSGLKEGDNVVTK